MAAMTDAADLGRAVLIVAVGFAAAILSSRISDRLRIPAPALFLAVAAVSSDITPALTPLLSVRDVERICLVALIVILFDGGMDIGLSRFRRSLWPIVALGVPGTFAVAGLLALFVHAVLGFGWTPALLIGAAVAPTDPAVMFSVLGGREVAGRSDDILKGESGMNDPVGIALVIGLLDAADSGGSGVATIFSDFAVQMAVGLAVGVLGGALLGRAMRRVSLPDEALYPLLTLAGAGIVYGLAAVAHGSGFLAVFVAGIMVGDLRAPYKHEVEHVTSVLASLGEIVVFVALGLTIDVGSLGLHDVWLDGIVIAAVLTFLVRPAVVAAMLGPADLRLGEKAFISWAGMRGAVPILLAAFALLDGAEDAHRIYGIVFVVVMFSVVVQGSLVGAAARAAGVPMTQSDKEPWHVSVRLSDEPQGVRRYVVRRGARADGAAIRDLPMGRRPWISLLIRNGAAQQARGSTVLEAGDEVLLLGADDALGEMFEGSRPEVEV
jgi:potassium/hydrogen antiporter